jgi:hypothetical protein
MMRMVELLISGILVQCLCLHQQVDGIQQHHYHFLFEGCHVLDIKVLRKYFVVVACIQMELFRFVMLHLRSHSRLISVQPILIHRYTVVECDINV